MIKKTSFLLLLLALNTWCFSAVIHGFAPDFKGKMISMYTYSDYLTLSKVKIGEAMVDPGNGTFELSFDTKQIIKVLLAAGNTNAEIYLGPDTDYELYYKLAEDTPISFATQKATTYFKNLDSTDINYKVLKFNNWFDEFIYVKRNEIMRFGMSPQIDTFKLYAYNAYANEKDAFFNNYVRYFIANLEQLKVSSKYRKTKMAYYLEYIKPFPVSAFDDQYMAFIKGFYSNDLNSFSKQIESDIVLAILHQSPSRLMRAMHRDPYFEKDEIRELMMVNMLGNAYYKRQYNRNNIQVMLDSIVKFAKFKSSGLAAQNIIGELTKAESGYPAPEFVVSFEGKELKLTEMKDKFVYMSFFATWNPISMNDLTLMQDLYVKYSEYVTFISFCTDKDKATFDAFLLENPGYDWPIVYLGEEADIIKDFKVASIPYYILIDQEGIIARSPAGSPSPDGLYKTIEDTFKYIKTQMDK
ncbi:hypothetical protein DNU06_07800 [Putridiphycobacter roseus]|uniref:Thioredoxin domain-containing protein n=1 Tax=Putridiphycobacter roseus TaxID=2219161 RepID=A0A2W1N1P6_9FLAO|nr:TlpA disulfide reductase family protein [Putridiphycobacter roseus]PZE17724.1 hypothetical protein DNU06_07800 [Putridiphycobacter roseus]